MVRNEVRVPGRGAVTWAVVVALLGGLAVPARASLLVHYTFDEAASGTTTAINTGTLGAAFNGTFNGTATRVNSTPAGFSTAAADLDGGGFSNSVGSGADIGPLTKLTVTMWVNLQTQPASGFRVFGSDLFSTGVGHGWFLYFTPSPSNLQLLGMEVDNAATQASTTVNAFNNWLFVAATWDQTATGAELNFYAGTPTSAVAQVGTTQALTTSMTTIAGAFLRVGGYSSNPGTSPDALIDDFRVYDEVRTDLNAIRLVNLPEPASAGLLALGAILLGPGRRRR